MRRQVFLGYSFLVHKSLVRVQAIKKELHEYSRVVFKFRAPVKIILELLESQGGFFLKTSFFYFLLFFHPFDV